MNPTHQTTSYSLHSRENQENRAAQIAVEAEVMLSVNGEEWLSFHCSPDHIEALAVGFLFNGGFIQSAAELASVKLCEGQQNVDVWLRHSVKKPEHWSRTSGCQGGVVQSGPVQELPRIEGKGATISALLGMVDAFLSILVKKDQFFEGVHTSVLFDREEILLVRNDIGRHNTLDKIAGESLLKQIDLIEPVLMTTGRISSEMIYKAARMKVPFIVSLHSTSSMAIEAAGSIGITLAGHARHGHLEIYSYPERIQSI
jgi:FdhD protein